MSPAWLAGCLPEERVRTQLELEHWAADRGYHLGPSQGLSPQGLGRKPVAKWRQLTAAEIGALDAIAVWSPDGREAVVWVRATLARRQDDRARQVSMFGGK